MENEFRGTQQATLNALYAWISEGDEAVDLSGTCEQSQLVCNPGCNSINGAETISSYNSVAVESKEDYWRSDSGVEWSLPAIEDARILPIKDGKCKKYPKSPTNARIDTLKGKTPLCRQLSEHGLLVPQHTVLSRRASGSDVISTSNGLNDFREEQMNRSANTTPKQNTNPGFSPLLHSLAKNGRSINKSTLGRRQTARPGGVTTHVEAQIARRASFGDRSQIPDSEETTEKPESLPKKTSRTSFLRQLSMPGLRGGSMRKSSKSLKPVQYLDVSGVSSSNTKNKLMNRLSKKSSKNSNTSSKDSSSRLSTTSDLFEFGAEFDSPLSAVAVESLVDGVQVDTSPSNLVCNAIQHLEHEQLMNVNTHKHRD